MSLSLDEVGSGWVRWVRLGELGFACEKLCKVGLGLVRLGEAGRGWMGSVRTFSDKVRLAEVRCGLVKWVKVYHTCLGQVVKKHG